MGIEYKNDGEEHFRGTLFIIELVGSRKRQEEELSKVHMPGQRRRDAVDAIS